MSLVISQELDRFAELLNPKHSANIGQIANEIVKIDELARTVMNVATRDLEKLLKAPIENNLSILEAAQHYEKDPTELEALVQTLWHNQLALENMRTELHLLSQAIRSPNAPGA